VNVVVSIAANCHQPSSVCTTAANLPCLVKLLACTNEPLDMQASPAGDGSNPDPSLPQPWQAHVSKRTGKVSPTHVFVARLFIIFCPDLFEELALLMSILQTYWFNTETKETTWFHPVTKAPSVRLYSMSLFLVYLLRPRAFVPRAFVDTVSTKPPAYS
jgi:hypothetical protein